MSAINDSERYRRHMAVHAHYSPQDIRDTPVHTRANEQQMHAVYKSTSHLTILCLNEGASGHGWTSKVKGWHRRQGDVLSCAYLRVSSLNSRESHDKMALACCRLNDTHKNRLTNTEINKDTAKNTKMGASEFCVCLIYKTRDLKIISTRNIKWGK